LLPGIMAISMIFTGVWAVAMPLIAEFQFTHEIEDRLLAPIENSTGLRLRKFVWRCSGGGCGTRSDTGSVAVVASGSGIEPAVAVDVSRSLRCWWRFFCVWWSGAWVQHRSESDRIDVQHGADADDLSSVARITRGVRSQTFRFFRKSCW
jgi:hypothetical protein